jgi:S-formylglutathione hydrolase
MFSSVTLGEITSQHLPASVPYAILAPNVEDKVPLCILLVGAGGTRESLLDLQSPFEGWWTEGSVPPMIIAMPSPGQDYYMEDPSGSIRWDSFLASDFIPHLRATCNMTDTIAVAGISGGGYGALKMAFTRPSLFGAVAAMQPMLEPALHESDVGPRNRLHHTAGGPAKLIGSSRDASVWELNNPASIARANSQQICDSGLAIYIDAGDHDFLNAHDGAEFLHRVLWDLDLSHEYHLVRGADHGGPSMRPRLHAMFAWLGSIWNPPTVDVAIERAASAWLESGMQGKAPAGTTTSAAFIDFLRARFEPLRAEAARRDPTTEQIFGHL